jgi:hypothetical protein
MISPPVFVVLLLCAWLYASLTAVLILRGLRDDIQAGRFGRNRTLILVFAAAFWPAFACIAIWMTRRTKWPAVKS